VKVSNNSVDAKSDDLKRRATARLSFRCFFWCYCVKCQTTKESNIGYTIFSC